MIRLMKKILAAPTALTMFLWQSASAFAGTHGNLVVPFQAPSQAITGVSPEKIPQFLVTLLFVVGIVIAVVFLIYGGIKWILSGGDPKQVEGARNHIVAAIVGLIIVLGAFLILNLVFTIITGKPFEIGKLCIPSLANPFCTQ